MSETSPGSGRDSVEQLLESFLARWRRGERPSPEEYAARCPERADEIRELDRKSTRLNSSHSTLSRMPSSA